MDWPVQRQGDEGQNVRIVQYLLRDHGFLELGVDGDFGPATAEAVRGSQASRGLSADAIVGRETWEMLVIQVGPGDSGEAVRAVQEYFGLPVDGSFGPQTEQAVRDFQQEWAPPADGMVGPNTWCAMVTPKSGF
ncbi:MAG: peptidoglycan-binding protein [Actinomycetota bacterium]|nr:peptidoglycan-binding protein [Actinomycetota bacterium]